MITKKTFTRPLLILSMCIIMLFFFTTELNAKEFSFKYPVGQKYKIISKVDEKVYIDGVYSHQADIVNRISVEITDFEDGKGTLEGRFITTEKLKGRDSAYQIQSSYESTYKRGKQGSYTIDPGYYMPVVRNVPVFPESDIEVGDTWTKKGEEVHDFRRGYGIEAPVRIPFRAYYRYQGKETIDGKEIDVISVRYNVRHKTGPYYTKYSFYPLRISGFSDQTIYWDQKAGKPYAYNEQFSMLFTMSGGGDIRTLEFTGTAWARVTESTPMDKDKIAEEINKLLKEDKVPDAGARVDDRGVTIDLEDIRFDADSAQLRDSEEEKLDKIAKILRKYPDRHLKITGHTALAGSAAGRQQLSELRARRVAEYLIENGVRDEEEIMTEGKGAREPIADNDTPEGMRKNRRVEITILEN